MDDGRWTTTTMMDDEGIGLITSSLARSRGFLHLLSACYVDAHGEADVGLRRGRQLLLDRGALASAIDAWLAFDFTSATSLVAV